MKIGSLVECIKPADNGSVIIQPVVGEIYTVRKIEKCETGVGVWLEEIDNGIWLCRDGSRRAYEEPGYRIERFRELLPPADISEIYKDALTIPERGLILVKETLNTQN